MSFRSLPVPTATPAEEEVNDPDLVVTWLKSLKIRDDDAKTYAESLDNEGYGSFLPSLLPSLLSSFLSFFLPSFLFSFFPFFLPTLFP
jgi:hypothetical protein